MSEPVVQLERRREELFAVLAGLGDFRRGSVTETYRRCGKANCVCAGEEHPGHGPRYLWTKSVRGKTRSRQVSSAELDKVRAELARYQQFTAVTGQIVEINEAICEARPLDAKPHTKSAAPPDGEKGGSSARSKPSSPPR